MHQYAAPDSSAYFTAEHEGWIAGAIDCAGGHRKVIRCAASSGMTVDRDSPNRGVGRRLVSRPIERAPGAGILAHIDLSAYKRNEDAIRPCQKHGSVVLVRRRNPYYRDGEYLDGLTTALCCRTRLARVRPLRQRHREERWRRQGRS
jgi:GNAT superfamily N-acetyltransferase